MAAEETRIRFACPSCGRRLSANEAAIGLTFKCPKCGATVTAPSSLPTTDIRQKGRAKTVRAKSTPVGQSKKMFVGMIALLTIIFTSIIVMDSINKMGGIGGLLPPANPRNEAFVQDFPNNAPIRPLIQPPIRQPEAPPTQPRAKPDYLYLADVLSRNYGYNNTWEAKRSFNTNMKFENGVLTKFNSRIIIPDYRPEFDTLAKLEHSTDELIRQVASFMIKSDIPIDCFEKNVDLGDSAFHNMYNKLVREGSIDNASMENLENFYGVVIARDRRNIIYRRLFNTFDAQAKFSMIELSKVNSGKYQPFKTQFAVDFDEYDWKYHGTNYSYKIKNIGTDLNNLVIYTVREDLDYRIIVTDRTLQAYLTDRERLHPTDQVSIDDFVKSVQTLNMAGDQIARPLYYIPKFRSGDVIYLDVGSWTYFVEYFGSDKIGFFSDELKTACDTTAIVDKYRIEQIRLWETEKQSMWSKTRRSFGRIDPFIKENYMPLPR